MLEYLLFFSKEERGCLFYQRYDYTNQEEKFFSEDLFISLKILIFIPSVKSSFI